MAAAHERCSVRLLPNPQWWELFFRSYLWQNRKWLKMCRQVMLSFKTERLCTSLELLFNMQKSNSCNISGCYRTKVSLNNSRWVSILGVDILAPGDKKIGNDAKFPVLFDLCLSLSFTRYLVQNILVKETSEDIICWLFYLEKFSL